MTREHQGPIHGETKNLKVKSGNWLGEEEKKKKNKKKKNKNKNKNKKKKKNNNNNNKNIVSQMSPFPLLLNFTGSNS